MKFGLLFVLLASAVMAQDSPEAMKLYNNGVRLLDSGKGDEARKSFNTIVQDYPTSAYAKLAKEGLAKPLVGSIEFVDIKPLSEKELNKAFEAANARLRVGRPYNVEDGEQARTLIAQLMLKKRLRAKDITVTSKNLPDNKVDVTITIVH